MDQVYLNSFIVVCVWYHVTCLLGVGETEGLGEERRSGCKLEETNFERTLTLHTVSSNVKPVPLLFSQQFSCKDTLYRHQPWYSKESLLLLHINELFVRLNLQLTYLYCLYCCTVHFEDSLSITHQRIHNLCIIH